MALAVESDLVDEEVEFDNGHILNAIFGDSDDDSGGDELLQTDYPTLPGYSLHSQRPGIGESASQPDVSNSPVRLCCTDKYCSEDCRCLQDHDSQIRVFTGCPHKPGRIEDGCNLGRLLADTSSSCESWAWQAVEAVSGLSLLPGFLSSVEQGKVVHAIEEEGWFCSPTQNQAMRFGNLPPWLEALASHVHRAVLHGHRSTAPSASPLGGSFETAKHSGSNHLAIPESIVHRTPFFDQMIANSYEPREGILPHVDLLRFEDGIAIVSLLSDCVMTFTPADNTQGQMASAPARSSESHKTESLEKHVSRAKNAETAEDYVRAKQTEKRTGEAGGDIGREKRIRGQQCSEDATDEGIFSCDLPLAGKVKRQCDGEGSRGCHRCTDPVREEGGSVDGLEFLSECGEGWRLCGGCGREVEGDEAMVEACRRGGLAQRSVCEGEGDRVAVLLCAGDLLFMWGDARYRWKHGIGRETGLQEWGGREVEQQRRWSITLRRLCQPVE